MPPRKKTQAKPTAAEEIITQPQPDDFPVSEPSQTEEPVTDPESVKLSAPPGDVPEPSKDLKEKVQNLQARVEEAEAAEHLEPLDLEDLVDDSNRVRMAFNDFPLDIGEDTKVRVYIMAVPGEEGTLAATWFKNSPTGPVQAVPVRRISNWYDNSFITEDGESYTYTRSDGCRTCGNRLVTYRPWGGHVRVTLMSRRR
jgi:hypothetical protein